MARYIDADKLIEKMKSHCSAAMCIVEVTRQPTADVVEVNHGKWIYNIKYYSCSICAGKRSNLLLGTDAEFCPYCGAKMDGGKAE